MKRGGPLQRRTPLRTGSGFKRSSSLKRVLPLKRGKPLNPVNKERRALLRAKQFAEQADLCRELPCCVCGIEQCDPHHEPTRARGGLDADTVPLCRPHHDERHDTGVDTFQAKHSIDLLAYAASLAAIVKMVEQTYGSGAVDRLRAAERQARPGRRERARQGS